KLKEACEIRLNEHFTKYLLEQKQALQKRFNEMTIEDFEEKTSKLKNYEPAYPYKHYSAFREQSGLFATLHTKEELENTVTNITSDKFDTFAAKYKTELSELR